MSQPSTKPNHGAGAFLLVGGVLLLFIGGFLSLIGIVMCVMEPASAFSGHLPGALVLAQGFVPACLGLWAIQTGKRQQREAEDAAEKRQ